MESKNQINESGEYLGCAIEKLFKKNKAIIKKLVTSDYLIEILKRKPYRLAL